MSNPQTTTQTAPSWQIPYQQYGLNQSLANYQNGAQVAPFAPQQEQAINGISNLTNAGGGAPFTAAGNYLTNTLNGNPASNPYLDSMFNKGANQVQNRLSSEFAGSGRNIEGSAPIQADQMNNLATQLYGGAYNTGVQQQMNAAAQAVPYTQQAYGNLNNQFNAGQQVQNLSNQYIQAPQNYLNNYLSQVNGSLGATQTYNPAFNSGAGALGGALLGSQIGSQVSSNPYAGLLGGVAGGLLGYQG